MLLLYHYRLYDRYSVCVLYRSPHICYFKFSPSLSYLVILGFPTTYTQILSIHYTILTYSNKHDNGGGSSRWRCGEQSSVLLYYYRIIFVCCIGALIIHILNSLHHEVVRWSSKISSNHRILYKLHTNTLSLHYTTL